MNHYPYILFHKTPEQLRRLGARGGRAQARNRRARTALPAPRPQSLAARVAPAESTAEAIAVLDAQFPWLRGAEKSAGSRPNRASDPWPSHGSRRHHPGQALVPVTGTAVLL